VVLTESFLEIEKVGGRLIGFNEKGRGKIKRRMEGEEEGEGGGWKQEDRAKLLTFLHICILLFQIILKFTVLFKLE